MNIPLLMGHSPPVSRDHILRDSDFYSQAFKTGTIKKIWIFVTKKVGGAYACVQTSWK